MTDTENKEKSPVLKYWPQLLILVVVSISVGKSINSQDWLVGKVSAVEHDHEDDVNYLNEEDNGVRGDFESADACNKEIAQLQNEILYWKLKFELK